MNKKIDIIIPARLNSSRLPRKVLLKLGNTTMLERVYCNVKSLEGNLINKIFIAVDSMEVFDCAVTFCSEENVIMTSDKHINGTSRIREAIGKTNSDFVINIQADEPFLEQKSLLPLIDLLNTKDVDIASTYSKITNIEEFNDPNVVKVVLDKNSDSIYFSRSPIPYFRNLDFFKDIYPLRHNGVYAYSKKFLENKLLFPQTVLSEIESLEQLSFLENGIKIKMVEIETHFKGIDTYQDYLAATKKIINN
jgi:3-deoxy-manno-octulosonate cytidylyltransferase (CMP-KDO synthetase)